MRKLSIITGIFLIVIAGITVVFWVLNETKSEDNIPENEPNSLDSLPYIVKPLDESDLSALSAREVRRYIYLRTDQLLEIQSHTELPEDGNLIVVAEATHPMIERFDLSIPGDPSEPYTWIKTIEDDDRMILLITGSSDTLLLNAAYRYAEHLGIFFGLSEDVIPDEKISLTLSGFDEVGRPNFETIGTQPYHDFPSGPDLWRTEEYLHFVSQLPKMGMNFIGIHTYPTYNSLWDQEGNHQRGPEPNVWIGMEDDFDATTGEVTWSYPAYYAHSRRPHWIWGFDVHDTGKYHAGARELFPTDGWGTDAMGETPPMPGDIAASNVVFNEVGSMFNIAFTHAQRMGVQTALGTELPLGVEHDGSDTWVRGIPPSLQERLIEKGKDPADPQTVKDLYKGIFSRIMATHPLDYYWLWSYEIWPGDSPEAVNSYETDIALALEALNELGNPFQIAHAGWQLGTNDDPAELDDVFPKEAPFFSLMGSATGYDQLSEDRVKWPSTWLEYDRSLGQPELAVDRIHEDAYAAYQIAAEGFITEHWRTRIMSPNIGAMRALSWTYGPSSEAPIAPYVPAWPSDFVDQFYLDWATRMFGPEVAEEIAEVFLILEYDMPHPVDWTEEQTGDFYMVPGAIIANPVDWAEESQRYEFVETFENLRSSIEGEGNLERFDYWLKSWQSLKLKGEYGSVRFQFEKAMEENNWESALDYRVRLASLFETIMQKEVEKVSNVSDLGDIMNLEVVNWKQLMVNKHDDALTEGLGYDLPPEAYPSDIYKGEPFIRVLAPRTQVNTGEALKLDVIAMGTDNPVLKYRTMGELTWNTIELNPVGRSVYEVNIPAQPNDFEYMIESGMTKTPASANNPNPTYHTVVIFGESLGNDLDE